MRARVVCACVCGVVCVGLLLCEHVVHVIECQHCTDEGH